MCTQPYVDQTKKILNILFVFGSVFHRSLFFKFCTYFVFQCFKLVFMLKNKGLSLSRVVRDLATSPKAEKCIFGHQAVVSRVACESLTSSSQVTHELALREMPRSAIS